MQSKSFRLSSVFVCFCEDGPAGTAFLHFFGCKCTTLTQPKGDGVSLCLILFCRYPFSASTSLSSFLRIHSFARLHVLIHLVSFIHSLSPLCWHRIVFLLGVLFCFPFYCAAKYVSRPDGALMDAPWKVHLPKAVMWGVFEAVLLALSLYLELHPGNVVVPPGTERDCSLWSYDCSFPG